MRNKYVKWLFNCLIAAVSITTSCAQTNLPKLDPKEFVTREYRHLSETIKSFSEADLPVFLEIIGDEKRPFHDFYPAILTIGHISGKGNETAVDALLDFLKRPVNWDKWVTNNQAAINVLQPKRQVLTALCQVGGDKAEDILKRAITAEGAQEFTKAWIGGWPANHPAGSREDMVGSIRGSAADALARIEKYEDVVRAEYARERQVCIESGKRTEYLSGLISGMGYIDARQEVGKGNPIPDTLFLMKIQKYQLTTTTNKSS